MGAKIKCRTVPEHKIVSEEIRLKTARIVGCVIAMDMDGRVWETRGKTGSEWVVLQRRKDTDKYVTAQRQRSVQEEDKEAPMGETEEEILKISEEEREIRWQRMKRLWKKKKNQTIRCYP